MQPANLLHFVWQLLILLSALCIPTAEEGDFFFLLFQRETHEVLKGLLRVKVLTEEIPKYKFTSQQYNRKLPKIIVFVIYNRICTH